MNVKKILENDSDLKDDLLLSYKENNDNILKRNFSLSEEEYISNQENEYTRSEGKNGDFTKINKILRKSNPLRDENKIIDDSNNSDKANYDKN